ncbi:MAG: MFS transporter, partial [Lachnospiraceae bacterium]|nr:MFS transporter [Lachnospiraceae bacterium]
MKKIHYSWFICIGCTLLMFCTAGLGSTGFSTYLPYLISIKGLANVQISIIVFVRSLFGVLSMLFVNSFLHKFEIRRVATAAMLVCGAAFIAFGLANSFAGYCVAAAIAGTAYGFGGMIPASILISRWFNDHRGLALGIVMASTGVSTFIASPIITALVEHLSLSPSFFLEAGFIFLAGIVVWVVLRSEPACLHTVPLGADKEDSEQVYAPKTASKSLIFAMAFGWLLLGAAANNLHSHLSVLYQSVGFNSSQISTVISLFGISLAIGKCTYGQLSDKIGLFRSCSLLFLISLVGTALCCLARISGFPLACLASIMVGFGMAVASVATATYAVESANETDYPRVVSI